MKALVCIMFLVAAVLCHSAYGLNIEFNGGWAHITGNDGLDGFNVGTAFYFTPKISIAVDYDGVYDTSSIGPFAISQFGSIVVSSHMQNFLAGPRIFFPGLTHGKKLKFFGEAQFGGAHLNSTIRAVQSGISQSASDTEFAWLIGGGADYKLSPHWTARGKLGYERTNFANEGQNRLRLMVGVSYSLGSR